MKIAVASIIQETSSFNPDRMTLQNFKDTYFKLGGDVVDVRPTDLAHGGFAAAMKPTGNELVGILAAHAGAGPALAADAFSELRDLLVSGLKKAGRFDAVFLSLMGAMVADGEPDATGVMMADVRREVGPDRFIGVAMDHHGNITRRMVEAADVIVGYETQPHDFPGAGVKTARVMMDIWQKKRAPRAALVKIPMITPQDHYLTSGGPMKEWFDLAREIEKDPAVIVATTCPTQPWLDVPEYGWASLVYADEAGTAQACAKKLAQKAWDLREKFWRSERLSVADTVAAANAEAKGLVVISDTGDSAWGGAAGDSMVLTAEMLKQGLDGPALVPVVDPEALAKAAGAGIGRQITLRLGGKFSSEFAPGLEITGTVRALADGGHADFGDGRIGNTGRSALFECGQLKIAIRQFIDVAINHPIQYEKLGLDVARAKMVVLKTASNFQYFTKYQSRLIRSDSPGATQSDLTTLKWRHINHPIYPLDPIKDWKP